MLKYTNEIRTNEEGFSERHYPENFKTYNQVVKNVYSSLDPNGKGPWTDKDGNTRHWIMISSQITDDTVRNAYVSSSIGWTDGDAETEHKASELISSWMKNVGGEEFADDEEFDLDKFILAILNKDFRSQLVHETDWKTKEVKLDDKGNIRLKNIKMPMLPLFEETTVEELEDSTTEVKEEGKTEETDVPWDLDL